MAKNKKPTRGWVIWDFWKELVGGGSGSGSQAG